jgi:hypothetical protein
MSDVFISWSSADNAIVHPLRDTLKNSGYSVEEYSVDPAGGSISANVRRYVDEARLVIFVFSPSSVGQPWIQTEVDWVYYRRVKEQFPEVIPLLVGGVDEGSLPHLVRKDPLLRKFKVPAGPLGNRDELQLKETVRVTLGLPPPLIVPAALFAMNRQQAEALLALAQVKDSLSALCGTVGMAPFPELKESLLKRYGATAEDFSPFPEKSLKEVVQQTIADTNKARLTRQDPTPLWIWWCTDALLNPTHQHHQSAADLWNDGPSIAVVDSISVLDQAVYNNFLNLPVPQHAASSALLWVPPYTLHTAQLEKVTENTFSQLNRLLQEFRNWRDKDRSYLAFDIGTRPTLRRWIYQAFIDVRSQAPRADNVDAMRQVQQSQFKTGSFFVQ